MPPTEAQYSIPKKYNVTYATVAAACSIPKKYNATYVPPSGPLYSTLKKYNLTYIQPAPQTYFSLPKKQKRKTKNESSCKGTNW